MEAKLVEKEGGLAPEGDGWFVINVHESRWDHHPRFGSTCFFEGDDMRFPELGINLRRLARGQSMGMYHGEARQEGFLVLSRECTLLIEGEERPLRQWDFVNCPPWTEHMIVGGDSPALVLCVGAGGQNRIRYPRRHGAGVEQETDQPGEAYAAFERETFGPPPPGFADDV